MTQKLLNCLFPNSVLHPISSLCCCTATEPRYTRNEEGYFRPRMPLPSIQPGFDQPNLSHCSSFLYCTPTTFLGHTFSFRFDEKIRSQAKKPKFSDRFAKRRKRKQTKPPVAGPQTLRQQSKRSSTGSAGVLRFLMCLTVNGPLTHLL